MKCVKYSLGHELFVLLWQEALVIWEKCWKGYECVNQVLKLWF